MMSNEDKEFDKEEIRKIVGEYGLWQGISNEWRISTNSDLAIDVNAKGEYCVSIKCGDFSISDKFHNFDDAWAALDRLHEVMTRYASTVHLWLPSMKSTCPPSKFPT